MSGKATKWKRYQDKRMAHSFLLGVMARFRKWLAADLPRQGQAFPAQKLMCKTCAFRSATDDWKGMEVTVLGFMNAMREGKPFYCHVDPRTGEDFPIINGKYLVPEAMAMGKPVDVCAGWSAVAHRTPEEVTRLIAAAAKASGMVEERRKSREPWLR